MFPPAPGTAQIADSAREMDEKPPAMRASCRPAARAGDPKGKDLTGDHLEMVVPTLGSQPQMLHVWNIYLHLPSK